MNGREGASNLCANPGAVAELGIVIILCCILISHLLTE